jgi:hypothetical protein
VTDTSATIGPARRYAHDIAPAPEGHLFFDENQPVDTIVKDLARHHIARAYGFLLTASDATHPRMAQAMTIFLYEYQLASIWYRLAVMGEHDPEQIAVDVVTDLASPQVLVGGQILDLLEWAGIAPLTVLPYMPDPA